VALGVLIVCTANQCRSPLAEHLLRRGVDELGLDWAVSSAGTKARRGTGMHPQMAGILEHRGIPVDGWSSQPLTGRMIDEADLILTAETAHRAVVVTSRPNALPRTFTLLQFARLAEGIDEPLHGADRDRQLIEHVQAARSLVPTVLDADDIADPIGGRRRAFERCAKVVDDAVHSLLRPLGTGH
jgi:protein-tyrosine-phosphatase